MLAVIALVAMVAVTAPALADRGGEQTYAVTVTNVTRGQVLSPPVVIMHDRSFSLFTPGEPASSELAQLAEDAVSGPLLALLGVTDSVFDVNIGAGPVPPGGSITVEVSGRGRFRYITVAGMLVTTNDAFFSGRVPVRGTNRQWRFAASAYDAGSEGNTESCDHIPGPPCGNALVRVPDSAEGFVHVHAGIHGDADLVPSMHDWRNPTALVTVERSR
jgi:hypothetical protein